MLLGLLIGASTTLLIVLVVYVFNPDRYQGELIIKREEGHITYLLEVSENPDGFQHMKSVKFKVTEDDTAK